MISPELNTCEGAQVSPPEEEKLCGERPRLCQLCQLLRFPQRTVSLKKKRWLFIFFIFKKKFILYWSILINNVVLVSGVQQSDSVIPLHVSILFQILFPFRLLQSIG